MRDSEIKKSENSFRISAPRARFMINVYLRNETKKKEEKKRKEKREETEKKEKEGIKARKRKEKLFCSFFLSFSLSFFRILLSLFTFAAIIAGTYPKYCGIILFTVVWSV